jgi:hypothetical protein
MSAKLLEISQPELLTEQVLTIRDPRQEQRTIISEIGGGVLRFSNAIFPEIDRDQVYYQSSDREAYGRGAHFDVYQNFIHQAFPWIGIFNLSGSSELTILDLPEDLAESYKQRYPNPNDVAFYARRQFSEIALTSPGARPVRGTINPGTGLVIPQRHNGPHVIHDVVPLDTSNPGKFVKLVIPSGEEAAKKRLRIGGYEPLDEALTKAFGGTIDDSHDGESKSHKNQPSRRLKVSNKLGLLKDFSHGVGDRPPSRCNLD